MFPIDVNHDTCDSPNSFYRQIKTYQLECNVYKIYRHRWFARFFSFSRREYRKLKVRWFNACNRIIIHDVFEIGYVKLRILFAWKSRFRNETRIFYKMRDYYKLINYWIISNRIVIYIFILKFYSSKESVQRIENFMLTIEILFRNIVISNLRNKSFMIFEILPIFELSYNW